MRECLDELVWYIRLIVGYTIGISMVFMIFVFILTMLVKHGRLLYTILHFGAIKVRYHAKPREPIPMQWVFPDKVALLACWHPNPLKWNFGYTAKVE